MSAGLDHRSLAAFRIAFGLTLCANWWIRVKDGRLLAHYTDQGVLPVESLNQGLARWSFLDALTSVTEVQVGFAVILAVYLAYTLGLFTRVMKVLVVLCLISIYHRNPLIDDGSDWTMRFLAIWTAFLPLGRRWSLDVRWRRVKPLGGGHESFAAWGFAVNLALCYFLNAYQKDGATWHDLSAVGLVVWDPYLSTGLAEWARPNMGPWVTKAATAAPRFVEYMLAFSLTFALRVDGAKRLTAALIFSLHLGFVLFLNLGTFGYMYMAAALIFIPGADWDRLTERRPPRDRRGPHPLALVACALWCSFVLFELVTKNPRIPKPLATAGWSLRSLYDPIHELLMVPQEWFMFRAPGRHHGYIVIEVWDEQGHRDFLRPGSFDLARPARHASGVGKYWTSYLHRLDSPALMGWRDELARYLERQGVDRFVVHKVDLLLPTQPSTEPSAIEPRVMFWHRAPLRVDLNIANVQRGKRRPPVTPQRLFGDWRGGGHLVLHFVVGSEVHLQFRAPEPCLGDVVFGYTRAPDFGLVELAWNGEGLGTLDGYDSLGVRRVEARFDRVEILAGLNRIALRSVGKNAHSSGVAFGVDDLAIHCE